MTTPPLKETPEEMEKRISAKIKADEPMEIPPSLDPSSARVKKADGGMGGMKQYLIPVIISFIISYLVVTFVATSPLNTQLKTVNTTANSALTAANTAIDNAKKAQTSADGASTAVTSVSNNMTSMNNQISALQSNISSLQGNISTINTQLGGYVTTSQIAGMASADQVTVLNKTISDLQSSLADLKTQLATDEAALGDAQAAIKTLQTATTTPPPSTTTTTTVANVVTASIPTNLFGTPQSILFASLPTALGNTSSGSFTFTITNATGVTANNIQLGLILQTIVGASTSNPLPIDLTNTSLYNATVNVNLNGYIISWSSQVTNQAGVLAFVNNIPTGILAGLGTLSQGVGTSNPYTVTVTVTTNDPTKVIPSFTVIPVVKVVSYTN